MTYDWSVIWQHRQMLIDGVGLTLLLTVLTMLVAVPGGIVLALMRLSSWRWLSVAAPLLSSCFATCP